MLVRGSGCAAPDYSGDSIINKHNLGSEASDLDNASLAERSNGTEKQEEEKKIRRRNKHILLIDVVSPPASATFWGDLFNENVWASVCRGRDVRHQTWRWVTWAV